MPRDAERASMQTSTSNSAPSLRSGRITPRTSSESLSQGTMTRSFSEPIPAWARSRGTPDEGPQLLSLWTGALLLLPRQSQEKCLDVS